MELYIAQLDQGCLKSAKLSTDVTLVMQRSLRRIGCLAKL